MTVTEPPVAEEQLPPEPPRKRRARLTPLGKLVVFLLVILIPLGALGGYAVKVSGGSGTGREVSVVIEPGSSASTIAATLEDAGVIKAAWLFRLYARVKGTAKNLKPGEYVFRRNMGYGAVVALLEKGPKIEFTRATVPEGKTVRETAAILGKVGYFTADQFLAEATNGTHKVYNQRARLKNLEGFLFPKTYDFKEGTTAGEAIDILLRQYEKETSTLDWSRASKLGVNAYQIMVIASMIEREARVEKDRAKVARVIYNRIERGMRLQIDATVQYGIFLKTGSYKNPLLTEDYKFSSPYNTYLIDGLPPAPIASPGLASIKAALNPADGKWLYYVLINDKGEHGFAETYDEFVRLKNSR
ncbi:MAG: endolytic transglycosylase MltG [Actinomycetota bacterium]